MSRTLEYVHDEQAAHAVGDRIMDPNRRHIIVVAFAERDGAIWLDLDFVVQQVVSIADIYLIEPRLTDAVMTRVPVGARTFGPAIRIYPAGTDWHKRQDLSRYFAKATTTEAELVAAIQQASPTYLKRRTQREQSAVRAKIAGSAEGAVVPLSTKAEVDEFVRRLRDPAREHPFAVVTTQIGKTGPDPQRLLRAAPGEVEVYLIPTGSLTFYLAEHIGQQAAVFGTAGRVYPVGTEWQRDSSRAPLRLVVDDRDPDLVADWLVDDVLSAVWQARAMGFAATNSAAPQPKPHEDAPSLAGYEPGAVVLAKVGRLTDDQALLQLHPKISTTITVTDITDNSLDLLGDLLTEGEVVAVRLTAVPPEDWAVTMLDIDDDEVPLPAPPVRAGDGPWITLGYDVPQARGAEDFQDEDFRTAKQEPATSAPLPGSAEVQSLRRQLAAAQRDLAMQTSRAEEARQRALEAEGQLTRTRENLQQVKARSRKKVSARPVQQADGFINPETEFRWRVFQAWVEIIPAAEKAQRPLPDYWLGPSFLASLKALHGVRVDRVAKVVVRVLLGLANDSQHRLRSGNGGDDPAVTAGDSVCWRVWLEQGTPSARRLHYWSGPGGAIELSWVGLHDDMTPGPEPTYAGDGSPVAFLT